METVVIIIMILVSLGFVLKLTFVGMKGRCLIAILVATFVIGSVDFAITQSKTQISDWLSQPELMLDVAVLITIDVAFQVLFCTLTAIRYCGRLSFYNKCLYNAIRYIPGILIFPVLFIFLTETIFSTSGVSFSTVGWGVAALILLLVPLLSYGFNKVIPEYDIRLELLFMLNLLIAALGVIATVNGRASADGTNSVSWYALLAFLGLTAVAVSLGLIINKHHISKKITKLQ